MLDGLNLDIALVSTLLASLAATSAGLAYIVTCRPSLRREWQVYLSVAATVYSTATYLSLLLGVIGTPSMRAAMCSRIAVSSLSLSVFFWMLQLLARSKCGGRTTGGGA